MDTQITGIFFHNLGDYYQNFYNNKITPSHKENMFLAFNNFIAELLGLKFYKKTHQPVNNRPSAMSLDT